MSGALAERLASYTPELRQKMVERVLEGTNVKELSELTGIPEPTLILWTDKAYERVAAATDEPPPQLEQESEPMAAKKAKKRVPVNKIQDADRTKALKRVAAGEPVKDVARDLGVTAEAIYMWRRKDAADSKRPAPQIKEKEKGKRRAFSDEFKRAAAQRVHEGEIVAKVAIDMNLTPSALSAWVKQFPPSNQTMLGFAEGAKRPAKRPAERPGTAIVPGNTHVLSLDESATTMALRMELAQARRTIAMYERMLELAMENVRGGGRV